jgi:glycosyltransferase involved in cell wall biosynthesis
MFISILFNSYLWIKQQRPDLIVGCYAFPDCVACWMLARVCKIKLIMKVHGSDINYAAQSKIIRMQICYAAKYATKIVAVSDDLKRKMIGFGIPSDKIEVIYNGVDHHLFNNKGAEITDLGKSFIFIGNLKKEKGIEELLAAICKVSMKYPEVRLGLVGPGPMLKVLPTILQRMNLDELVTIHGAIDHSLIPNFISKSKAIVLPSHNEGVPNVLLEAMAFGKPVIATRVGGIPEIVIDGVTGFLCDVKNVDSLADALVRCLETELKPDIIETHARNFTWEKNIEYFGRIIDETISDAYEL